MTQLEWVRSQMAFSLGFHIIFASISMVLPFFMAFAYWRYLKTREEIWKKLTKAWSKGAAVLFATGAVTGTTLSFQLGLLWPGFMEHAGPIIGMPFSLEGAAFFLEAIFLGLFLYGWEKLPEKWHFRSGLMVGVCGVASGILVVAANGWMNAPSGFDWVNGHAENIDPIKALFNKAWLMQATHTVVAAFQATSIAALGIHSWALWKGTNKIFHRAALRVIMPIVVVSSLIQPIIGDLSAKDVAMRQPEKLAAFEAHYYTEKGADLLIGGWPSKDGKTVDFGIKIPNALSFLAFGDFNAEVKGLEEFPESERPPVRIPHLAFQIMVGIGTLWALISSLWLFARFRKKNWFENSFVLKVLFFLTPTGFLALEAGWVVTEVGRQPWVIYKIMKTSEAVSPVPGMEYTFFFIFFLYLIVGFISFLLLGKMFRNEIHGGDHA